MSALIIIQLCVLFVHVFCGNQSGSARWLEKWTPFVRGDPMGNDDDDGPCVKTIVEVSGPEEGASARQNASE
jgi:hypothetical protein